jgi:hypothetical protein
VTETATVEPPTVSPPAALPPTGPLADLILVRLLPSSKSQPSPTKIREDLSGFFRHRPSAEKFTDTLAGLRTAGLITPKGQHLTDAGRTRALAYLGVKKLPAKANWGTIKTKYLVPKALNVSPDSIRDAKKLAPLLLKRKLNLPAGTNLTLPDVFEAIACRELGFPEHTTLKSLVPILLGRVIGSSESLDRRQAESVVPRVLLGAKRRGAEGLRETVLTGWITEERPVPSDEWDPPSRNVEDPFDLETFANTVKAAARTCPTGRFGDNKVFISHVWGQLTDNPQIHPLGFDGFKAKLVEANRENLLTLSRADLVQVMDPVDVRESETHHMNAVFHFISVERN